MYPHWRFSYVVFTVAMCQISCTSTPRRDNLASFSPKRVARSSVLSAEAARLNSAETEGVDETSDITLANDSRTESSAGMPAVPGPELELSSFDEPQPDSKADDRREESTELPRPEKSAVLSADSTTEAPATQFEMEPAELSDNDSALPINLASALRLANARPLVIAAAQSSAWIAEARLQRAKLLWIPEFNLGAVYYRHDGYGPDFNRGQNFPAYGAGPVPGGPLNQNLNYFYAYGSFYQTVNLTDAIFQPLAARQVLDAERHEIQTAKNDALLATATAYFDVHQYRGQYTATLDVIDRAKKLVDRIEQLSEDLVPRVEVDRSQRLLAGVSQRAAIARERWRVASANLTQTLRLDPSAVIVPLEQDHLQITLIDPARPIDDLIAIALCHRPEISARRAQIRAAEARVRQEKYRPMLPTVLLTGFQTNGGMRSQFGIFGEGSGSKIDHWSLREDVSVQLIWQLEGLGFGNLARIREERGAESETIVRLFHYQDAVAAEVTASQAKVQSAAVQVVEAERELRDAIVTYEGNYEGLAQTTRFNDVLHQVFRPQEAVRALDQLMNAYDRYYGTVADYNRAQFALFHSLGYPAAQISELQPPGEFLDTDLHRPFDLPPVIDGPPASTY